MYIAITFFSGSELLSEDKFPKMEFEIYLKLALYLKRDLLYRWAYC